MVVALMKALTDQPVRTFSIGFTDPDFDEARYAHSVARHLGTSHTEHYVGPKEAIDVIGKLPLIYDEPLGDQSQVPTFLVAELARRDVTVALSGDGGDELFVGYSFYPELRDRWLAMGRVPRPVRQLVYQLGAAAGRLAWALPGWVSSGGHAAGASSHASSSAARGACLPTGRKNCLVGRARACAA